MTLFHNTVFLTLLICTGFAIIVLFIWALIFKVIAYLMSRKRRNGEDKPLCRGINQQHFYNKL